MLLLVVKHKSKISLNTFSLIEERRRTIKDSDTYIELNKTIRNYIRKDVREYNAKIVRQTIEENSNMKVLKRLLGTCKQTIFKMKNKQEIIITD